MTVHSAVATPGQQAPLSSRSLGRKFLLVVLLALVMAIPALFVSGLLRDRASRAAGVTREVSRDVGGPQTFLGPILMIPYGVSSPDSGSPLNQGTYFVFPSEGDAVLKMKTQERRRSLFRVPVFQADVLFDAVFDLRELPTALPQNAAFDWSHAEVAVGVSDARGALTDATISVNGQPSKVHPATGAQILSLAQEGKAAQDLHLFGVSASAFARPDTQFRIQSRLSFSGAQRAAILAYGKSTHVVMRGDWPNPGFDGDFLPVNRSVTKHGFTAEWSVPYIARGTGALGQANALSGLGATAMGVSFVEVADPYQSVSRSLKYVLLFVGMVFLSYFTFEVTTGKLVHPAQYVLVGVAQIIFYLLLLSLSERVGFSVAFLIAGSATVGLLSMNANWVFASTQAGVRALAIFSALYTLIYLLLRLEDDALLLGAGASFMLVAIAMYLTRQVDWYSAVSPGAAPTPASPDQNAPRAA